MTGCIFIPLQKNCKSKRGNIMENNKVYLLFDCDEWRTYTSMDPSQPIAVAFSEEELVPMLIRDLTEDSKHFSEKNKALYRSLKKKGFDSKNEDVFEEILEAYKNSGVEYRCLIILEQGYEKK